VTTLIAEVDSNAASHLTLSMTRQPSSSYETPIQQIPEAEWVQIGTQAGFDPKKLGIYWQSLSNLALHVRLPKSKDEEIPEYGDAVQIRKQVTEIVDELKRIADGTMLTSGLGEEVSFVCVCGQTNRRRNALLRNRQMVSCVGVDCNESFDVLFDADEFSFRRRVISFDCICGENIGFPTREAEKLKRGEFRDAECLKCKEKTRFMWRLMKRRSDNLSKRRA